MDNNISNLKKIPVIPIYLSENNSKNINIFLSKYYEFLLINNEDLENLKNNDILLKIKELTLNDGKVAFILIMKSKKGFKENSIWEWKLINSYTKGNDLLDNTIIYNEINNKFLFTQLNEIINKIFKE